MTIEIIAPTEGTSVTGTSVRVAAWASGENPISSISLLIDGSRVLHVAGARIDAIFPVSVGNHTITVQATDRNGNAAEKSARFAVVAPRIDISIAAPLPDSIALAPVRVVAKASGSNSMASLRLWIDEHAEDINATSALDVRIPAPLGPHRLRIRATDSDGNTAEKTLQFTVSQQKFAVVSLMGTTDPEDGYFPFSGTVNSYTLDARTGALATVPVSTISSGGSFSQPFMLLKDEEAGLLFDFNSIDRNGPGGFGVFSFDKRSGQIANPAVSGALVESPGDAVLATGGNLLYVAGVDCPPAKCYTPTKGVGAWKVDRGTGKLTPVTGMPLATQDFIGSAVRSLSYDSTREFLFAADTLSSGANGSTRILTYKIDRSSGSLTVVSTKIIDAFGWVGPAHPDGKFLYVLDFEHSKLLALELGPSGPGRILSSSQTNAGTLVMHPSGRFVFVSPVPSLKPELVLYRIDPSTGSLLEATESITPSESPRGMAMDASGELIYITNGMNVSVFRLDKPAGKLEEIEGSPFRVGTERQPFAAAVVVMSTTQDEN